MDSTRANQTFFTALTRLKLSGQASHSSKKELVFLQNHSDAGLHAGVFFVAAGSVSAHKLAEVLH
jgi:hypothetical protein